MALIVDTSTNARAVYQIDPLTGLPLVIGGGGGGGGDASAANQALQITQETLINTRLGDTAAPAAGTVNARLATLNTTLGAPLQAGGTVGAVTAITNPVAVTGTFWQATQPVSGTVAVTGVATETTLAAMSAKLPSSLGAKTAANSISVAWASDAVGTAGTPAATVVTVQGVTSGTPLIVGGNVASGATDSGNPVKVGGVYSASGSISALTVGWRNDLQFDARANLRTTVAAPQAAPVDTATTVALPYNTTSNATTGLAPLGVLGYVWSGSAAITQRGDASGTVSQPYALTGSRWQYAAAGGGISNTTAAVTFIAAAGGSVRNYVTGIDISSTALGAATEIAIRDGAGGTVIWRGYIGTGGTSGMSINFTCPLKGTANTLLEIVTLTASITGAIYFNARGFQAL